jgi:hypothetical protein
MKNDNEEEAERRAETDKETPNAGWGGNDAGGAPSHGSGRDGWGTDGWGPSDGSRY